MYIKANAKGESREAHLYGLPSGPTIKRIPAMRDSLVPESINRSYARLMMHSSTILIHIKSRNEIHAYHAIYTYCVGVNHVSYIECLSRGSQHE